MAPSTHRIRRLRWLVRAPSPPTAFAQRQAIRRDLDRVLIPAVERALDEAVPDDVVVKIPLLTLHVVLREGADTTEELAARVAEQLVEALRREVGAETPKAGAQRLSQEQHRRALLLGYLATGRIAWEGNVSDTAAELSWLRAEAEALVASEEDSSTAVAGTLEARLAASFRLLQLLSPTTREAVLRRRLEASAAELVRVLIGLAGSSSLGGFLQAQAAAAALALREGDLRGGTPEVATRLLTAAHEQLVGSGTGAGPVLAAVERLRAGGGDRGEAHRPEATAPRTGDRLPPPAEGEGVVPGTVPGAVEHPVHEAPPGLEHAEGLVGDQPPGGPEGGAVLAADAGLILLHPFVPRFFEARGIIAGAGESLREELLPRAAALLHWLVTGSEEIFEFELSLSKVLIGLSPTDPLPVAIGLLSEEDRLEAEAVLAAAVGHWPALRNTSPEGLRRSFLQRRGLLWECESDWRLQVETAPYDMLLAQLPWSTGVVRLPWMPKPIVTGWPTP